MKKYYVLVLFFLFAQFNFSQVLFKEEANLLGIGESCGDTYLGNGVSFFDYNKDGWDDITLCTSTSQSLRFFKNTNGTFSEEFLDIPNTNYQTKQVNWVDFDNDGDYDLFLTSDTDGNKLLLNNGSMVFYDITSAAGLPTANQLTYGASWGDINNDGHLDLFISNRDPYHVHTNKLYKNNGDSTFTDISVSSGVALSTLSFCAAFFDYNNDGFQDIYVSNDKTYTPNLLYRNEGNETFTEVGEASNTDLYFDAMSVTIDDYNSDGWFDIYVTNSPEGNALLKNNGDGTFSDVTYTTGTEFESVGWGAVFLDADNDQDLDLYVSGSIDFPSNTLISAAFYKNNGDGTYSIPSDAGFDDDLAESYSNAIGDINNDGLPEIVVTNNNDVNIFLWNNNSSNTNNWLKIKLEGTSSNKDGIGSIIEITTDVGKQFRYVLNGEGYLSQNSLTEHFGVGGNTIIDQVKVTWLSGIEDVLFDVSANQVLTITEGNNTLSENEYLLPEVRVFPNPTSDLVFLTGLQGTNKIELRILDGSLLNEYLVSNSNFELDMSAYSSGAYFITISNSQNSSSYKIIKR